MGSFSCKRATTTTSTASIRRPASTNFKYCKSAHWNHDGATCSILRATNHKSKSLVMISVLMQVVAICTTCFVRRFYCHFTPVHNRFSWSNDSNFKSSFSCNVNTLLIPVNRSLVDLIHITESKSCRKALPNVQHQSVQSVWTILLHLERNQHNTSKPNQPNKKKKQNQNTRNQNHFA